MGAGNTGQGGDLDMSLAQSRNSTNVCQTNDLLGGSGQVPLPSGSVGPVGAGEHLCSVLKRAKMCLLDMKPFSTSRNFRLSTESMYFFSFS